MEEFTLETIIEWINKPFLHIGETPVTIGGIGTGFVVFILALIFSAFVQRLISNKLVERLRLDSGAVYALKRVLHYIIVVLGFVLAAQCIGLNLGSLAVVFGFLSVGIGFGLQNVTSNFISGLILLFERPISVHDLISIDNMIGRVEHIHMRATHIKTLDNISLIVPNSKFIETQVINWSHQDPKVRLHCSVGVAYGSDIELVKKTLLEVAEKHEEVLDSPQPIVRFMEFADSSLNFELLVWIRYPDRQFDIKSEINFAIDQAFRKANIQIPFPQRDLHIKMTPAVEQLAGTRRS